MTDFAGTRFVNQLKVREEKVAKAKEIQSQLVVGNAFPDFQEQDADGQPLSISAHRGKVVLVDFWATWCPPCREEVPNVVAVYKKYHDKGFDIVGVSLDQDKQKMLDFTKQNGMTWQQYFDGRGWDNKIAGQYGIESIPTMFVLDGTGKIIAKDVRGQELEKAVEKGIGGN